jgi:hypothetical protein
MASSSPFQINHKKSYIDRLNLLCQQAVAEGNLRCALQAEKMIGDAHGYFKKTPIVSLLCSCAYKQRIVILKAIVRCFVSDTKGNMHETI